MGRGLSRMTLPVRGRAYSRTGDILEQSLGCKANPCCFLTSCGPAVRENTPSQMGFQDAKPPNRNWNLWNTFSTCTYYLYTKFKQAVFSFLHILKFNSRLPFVRWFWVGQKQIHSKMVPNILNIKNRCNMPQAADQGTPSLEITALKRNIVLNCWILLQTKK